MSVIGEIANALGKALIDPNTSGWRKAQLMSGFTGSGLRLALGTVVSKLGARPEKTLTLYEFEDCPNSRRAREAISLLDLIVNIRPCPKSGTRFRPELERLGGKRQLPMLVDPNTDQTIYDSLAIVDHLFKHYGQGPAPIRLRSSAMHALNRGVLSTLTGHHGRTARPSRAPAQPLELYGFESSPFTRTVRQTLCELELPYLLTPMAKKSPQRPAFKEKYGKTQFPLLVDANTGTTMFESVEIQKYLNQTYAV